MSITEASLETNFNTYIGDTSTDRISAAERLQFATEATIWLQEELGNDHQVKTYALPYFNNIHYYKVTSTLASLLEGADLRRGEADQMESFLHLSGREMAERIGQHDSDSTWSLERHDGDTYLVVNHLSKYLPVQVSNLEATTGDGGTWVVDATNSDATNLTIDSNEFKQGSGSFNFDITVAQSSNNRATIQNLALTSRDWTNYENLASFVFWMYVPDVTYFTSVTLYWGSSTSAYWSATATTDVNGNAFVAGWNRVKITWLTATPTSTPSSSAITYMRFDLNYSASQANATDFRLDDLTLVRPETLTFSYTSWYVGTDTLGTTNRTAYTATSDIPFFSGQYDQYKYAVAHKMASLAYYGPLRNSTEGQLHEVEAIKALNRQRKLVPTSVTKEEKNFRPRGINFARRIKY